MHPFRLMDAFLAADRLWFRYELKGRVAAAQLAGSSVDLPLVDVAPGLLAGPVPEAGGRLTLLVEGASPAADLPWRVDVHLAPQALADYWAAEPLGATADLGDGMTLRADRLRRGPDGAVLFWSCRAAGSDLPWVGELHGNHMLYPHGQVYQRKGLRPAPAGQPSSAMEVRVQAVSFCAAVPPAWVVQHGHLQTFGEWEIDLEVPPERPAVLFVGREVQTGGGRLRLEEVWLSRFHTSLFCSGPGGADLFSHLKLTSGALALRHEQSSGGDRLTEYRFAPLPEGRTQLGVSASGAGRHLHQPMELPLVPSGKGRPARPEPGQWGGMAGFTVVEIPGSPEPPTGESPDAEALREWLRQRLTPAYRLEIEPAPYDSLDPRGSHLAGPPFRPAGAPWPVCGHCDQPLTFIGQMRLPDQGARLLTFYYCHECLPHGPEDASAYRLNLYDNVDSIQLEVSAPPNGVPCRVTMVSVQSAPHWEDAQADLDGLDLGPNPWRAYRTELEALTGAPNTESRVGGYPDWIQGPQQPSCPGCGKQMALLWQLDSEQQAGLMWGDVGRIYIFGCPDTCSPHSLALIMQCC